MAFIKKEWQDRVVEYPARRTLSQVSGQPNTYDVVRNEGTVTTPGDAFNAETMNDLENRIEAGLGDAIQYEEVIPSSLSPLAMVDFVYPVGSVFFSIDNVNPSTKFTGTSWELIGSKLAVRENVFGNGKGLALSNGNDVGVLNMYQGAVDAYKNYLGSSIGTANGVRTAFESRWLLGGVATKEQLGENPNYSGLIVDTETIYSWKRVA